MARKIYTVAKRLLGAFAELLWPCHIRSFACEGKIVAFTFDDGPHPETTPQLLELFHSNGGGATFFVCGKEVEKYPALCKMIQEYGSEVANHSFTHPHFDEISLKEALEECKSTSLAIEDATGSSPQYFRPPKHRAGHFLCCMIHLCTGMRTIGSNLAFADYNHLPAQEELEFLRKNIQSGAIVCLHDDSPETVEALNILLPELRAEGYCFQTISQMMRSSKPSPRRKLVVRS